MSDIVERLREFEHNWSDKLDMADACQDAADEIERNRAAIAELVVALKYARSCGIFATFVISDLDAIIAKHQQPTTTKEQ